MRAKNFNLKKLPAILFLIILMFQTAIWSVFILVQLKQNRTRIFKLISLHKIKNTNTLYFSQYELKNLNWTKFEKEFEFKGEMFDVLSISKKNKSYTLICYKDFKDKKFVSKLKNLNDTIPFAKNVLKKFFDSSYNIIKNNFKNFISEKIQITIYLSQNIKTFKALTETPPPQFDIKI